MYRRLPESKTTRRVSLFVGVFFTTGVITCQWRGRFPCLEICQRRHHVGTNSPEQRDTSKALRALGSPVDDTCVGPRAGHVLLNTPAARAAAAAATITKAPSIYDDDGGAAGTTQWKRNGTGARSIMLSHLPARPAPPCFLILPPLPPLHCRRR